MKPITPPTAARDGSKAPAAAGGAADDWEPAEILIYDEEGNRQPLDQVSRALAARAAAAEARAAAAEAKASPPARRRSSKIGKDSAATMVVLGAYLKDRFGFDPPSGYRLATELEDYAIKHGLSEAKSLDRSGITGALGAHIADGAKRRR